MQAGMLSFPCVGGGGIASSRRILKGKFNPNIGATTHVVNLGSYFCSHSYDKYLIRVVGSAAVVTSGSVSISYTYDNGDNWYTADQSSFGSTATWVFVTEAEIHSHTIVGSARYKITGVRIGAGAAGSLVVSEGSYEIIGIKN